MDPLPHQCGMDKTKREELEKAYKKEKNPRVAARMLAVHMVYVREKSVSATAADLMRTDKWVYDWLKRFDAGGLDGLRDLPKSGRPASVPAHNDGPDNRQGKPRQVYAQGVAGARTHRDQRQTAHHVHQKDHARVRSDPQDPTEGSTSTGPTKGQSKIGSIASASGFHA